MRTLDHKASRAVHGMSFGRLDYVLVLPGMLFGSYVMPAVVVVLGFALGWRFAAVAVMASLSTLAVTAPLKHWFRRQRPEAPPGRAFKIRSLVNSPAFPSGDSAQAAALVMLLVLLGPWGWVAGLAWVPLVPLCMFSRVYFGAHWWGDTVAGAAIGAGIGLLYAHLFGGWVV